MPATAPLPGLPPDLSAFARRGDDWQGWLERLPRMVRDLLREWELTADGPSTFGECALVLPVRTRDGVAAALKVGFPHEEAEHEHLALRYWSGDGAVRLLRADPHRSALLLERLQLRDLTTIDVLDACEVAARLYSRLHVAAPQPLRPLSGLAARWGAELAELPADAPVPRRYVEQAAALCRDFATDPATDGRLIHSDLHYDNVLAADRESWLAIDPKPLSGDPHHEVAPLLWNRWDEVLGSGDVRSAVHARFRTVVDIAGLDEDRARSWVVAREIVNAMWTIHDGAARTPDGSEWITRCVTIAKAMQD